MLLCIIYFQDILTAAEPRRRRIKGSVNWPKYFLRRDSFSASAIVFFGECALRISCYIITCYYLTSSFLPSLFIHHTSSWVRPLKEERVLCNTSSTSKKQGAVELLVEELLVTSTNMIDPTTLYYFIKELILMSVDYITPFCLRRHVVKCSSVVRLFSSFEFFHFKKKKFKTTKFWINWEIYPIFIGYQLANITWWERILQKQRVSFIEREWS